MQFTVVDLPASPELLVEARSLPFAQEGQFHPAVYRPEESEAPLLYALLGSISILQIPQAEPGQRKSTLRHVQMNRFKPGDRNPWHHDGDDPALTGLVMLYLTDELWSEADGGYLELGMRSGSNIQTLQRICPAHGRAVIIHEPRDRNLVHRVEELRVPKTRISVVAFYGTAALTSA